ncbi:disulfide isomerase [Comamonas serinivorans]|uniref:Thiol:disulfide interchange protein n=1 Tax=Comamonas serinivorans TaxID=1082851 RepID=A0A1Y0ELJ9_9BURK|nr:DsbC family protein [Comamonas serinivorans]ARU04524.1 disulfide isomerase [Comamonas serinivorans]
MTQLPTFRLASATLAACLLFAASAQAQESVIRKNLAARMSELPAIDEVQPTPMKGLYEIRIGTDLFYTDAEGNYLIQGNLLDTRAQKNLTQERLAKVTAIDFKSLPVKNAITLKRGNGKRQMAVFADPNCGYCKRFEGEIEKLDNVTVHVYLIPILGQDSVTKTRNIWCAKDKAATWSDWMLKGKAPAQASCNTAAIDANVALAQKYRITGTPTVVFESGRRVPGAIPSDQLEQLLSDAN